MYSIHEYKLASLTRRHKDGKNDRGKSKKCENCKKVFYSSTDLKTHIDNQHVVDVRTFCKSCHLSFSSNSKFTAHVQASHQTAATNCEKCNCWFSTLTEFRRHIERSHNTEGWKKQKTTRNAHEVKSTQSHHIPDEFVIPTQNRFDPLSKNVRRGRADN